MSVRTRLAGILAAVMLLPLLVAGADRRPDRPPPADARPTRDLVTQAATSLGSLEAEICRGLGDSATALALDVRSGDADGSGRARRPSARADSFALVHPRLGDRGQGRARLPTDAAATAPPAAPAGPALLRARHGSCPARCRCVAETVGVAGAGSGTGRHDHGRGRRGARRARARRPARQPRACASDVQLAVSCPGGGSDSTLKGGNRARLIAAAASSGQHQASGPTSVAVQPPSAGGQPCAFAAATGPHRPGQRAERPAAARRRRGRPRHRPGRLAGPARSPGRSWP